MLHMSPIDSHFSIYTFTINLILLELFGMVSRPGFKAPEYEIILFKCEMIIAFPSVSKRY